MIEIETERLKFRELVHSDIDNLQKIFSDPVTMEFYPSTKSSSETLDWIDWNIRSYKDNGFGLWALIDKMNGEFIGQCGIVLQHNVDGVDEREIGYLLVRKYWGRGFATEAASACRDYAFTKLNCQRIISLINPDNGSSIRVAERNGMIFEKKVERWDKTISVYMQSNICYNKTLQ